jgi:hypothetical protein
VALDGYGIQDPGGNLDEPPLNDVSKLQTADDSPDSSANTDLIGGAPDDSLTGPTDDAENDCNPENDDSTGGAGADPNEEVTAAEPDVPDLQDSDEDLIPLEDGQTVRLQEYEVTNSDHPRNHPESDDSNDDPTGPSTSEADRPIRDGERGPEESVSEDDATEQIAHNQDVLSTSDEDIAAFLSETSSNDEDASAVSEGLSKDKTESVLEVTDPQLITDESMGNDHTIGQTEDPSVDNHTTVESSDRVPTNDAQVERAWGISEKVDAGRSFMPVGDDMHEPAERIRPSPDEYTVFIHGNTHEVGIEHPNGDWQFLDAEGLADVIRSDPDWNGETVRLFSCDTGKEPDDGSPVFAQDLANELGSDVVAPSEKGFYFNGVDWVSSSREVTDPLTREVRHLPNSPPSNPDGRWEIFHPTPQGRSEQ